MRDAAAGTRVRSYGAVFGAICPLILALWPLAGAAQGIDLSDTTYALANYRALPGTGSTWYYATYLANRAGALLMRMPGGGTLLGMNVLTRLVVSLTALLSYFGLKGQLGRRAAFFGEWIAVALCWCPTVLLYNYLTYLLLTAGGLLLIAAVRTDRDLSPLYAAAGALLGLNVFVRFSNAAQALLIVALWAWAAAVRMPFVRVLRRTLLCIAGYAAGLLAGLGIVAARGGAAAYFAMIPELFSMTSQASDYTMGSMLASTLSAYAHTLRWAALMAGCAAAGAVFLSMPSVRRHLAAGRALYAAGMAVLLRFLWGHGMFTLNYADYGSMFEWGMCLLLLALVLGACRTAAAGKKRGGAAAGSAEDISGAEADRLGFPAAVSVMIVLISPLGSNNYTFPALNDLFIPAPFVLAALGQVLADERRRAKTVRPAAFAGLAMAAMAVAMLFVQGSAFHVRFSFRDGTDGTARTAQVSNIPVFAGMWTVPDNARTVGELAEALADASGETAIAWGGIPGVHYAFSLAPALTNLWPSLDSYPAEDMEEELDLLEAEGGTPVVIIDAGVSAADGSPAALKRALLEGFMDRAGYATVFANERFIVRKAGKN